jgi:separase
MTTVPSAPRKTRTTRNAVSRVKDASVSVDRLADQLTATLKISNAKGKKKVTPSLLPAEQKLQSMRLVNSASQRLSAIVQTGWKKSQEKSAVRKSSTLTDADESASTAATNLAILRELNSGDLDIERAGMSILSKLIALEMVRYPICLPIWY